MVCSLGKKLNAPTTQAYTFIRANNPNKCCWYACPSLPKNGCVYNWVRGSECLTKWAKGAKDMGDL